MARAVRVRDPVADGVHWMLYGAVPSDPMTVDPSRNSTWVTVPSGSLAVAETVTFSPTVTVAPAAGAVTDTTGGWLATPVEVNVAVSVTSSPGTT